MSAYEDLQEKLNDDEEVQGIVFGAWGWGSVPDDPDDFEPGYGEGTVHVPYDKRGEVMTLDEAEQYMQGWSFYGGHGAPECYAVYIWTTDRVMWVTQYDGATGLDSAPRHPTDTIPNMPGG